MYINLYSLHGSSDNICNTGNINIKCGIISKDVKFNL